MNNKAKNIRILMTVALAALCIVSVMMTVISALTLDLGALVARRAAVIGVCAVLLSGFAASSSVGAIASAISSAVICGIYAISNAKRFKDMGVILLMLRGGTADPALAVRGVGMALTIAAAVLGALFFALLYRREMTPIAITLLAGILLIAHALSDGASVAWTVPGLIAGVAAFALSGSVQRDAAAPRVLVPALLAVALALMLLPAGRVTWRPLEEAGQTIRGAFEQYFSFTHERIAFSINEQGYNHGGEVNGEPVAMLGGPAQPSGREVMRVEADGTALLRGTIRSTYTGYSWVDVTPKSRYLFYDLTHRTVRDEVFDMDFDMPSGATREINVRVEMLAPGTSTLFVPTQLRDFDMSLANAVYYNSAGEMFMARDVDVGDAYEAKALVPAHGAVLRQAVVRGEQSDDALFDEIYAANSEVPQCVESPVHALVIELTRSCTNAYDRAEAIVNYLRGAMKYELNVDYPPAGRDFVSWFVLDSKKGYCSYFATAMAVMGRIAGLPTRYVEGYLARPEADGAVTLTGRDAHAWAEVYFKGVGWVPFDATNGTTARGLTEEDEPQADPPAKDTGSADARTTPAPESPDGSPPPAEQTTPPPDDGENDQDDQDDQDDPTDDAPEDTPDDVPDDAPDEENADAPERKSAVGKVLLILLILLLLVALAVFIRFRLKLSDPFVLCAATKRASHAAMIAYRANLTLLDHMGRGPVNAETPAAFVERVSSQPDVPEFAAFVRAVELNRYGNRPLKRSDVAAGLAAYRRFYAQMGRMERARYLVRRIVRGLGDFEAIP